MRAGTVAEKWAACGRKTGFSETGVAWSAMPEPLYEKPTLMPLPETVIAG
jgi:hypothetical protein